jgi:hypothetical protein
MSEIQKIAIGLLGMSHPEIQRFRTSDVDPVTRAVEQATRTVEQPALQSTHAPMPARGSKPSLSSKALRGLKFAIAALLAGARSIPLGDNGRVTRELGEYGARLKGC